MKSLIDLIAGIGFKGSHGKARDTLGRVYEYFLGKVAAAEGKLGGEFYTPRSVVRVLVEMLEPYEGRIYVLRAAAEACSSSRKSLSRPTAAGAPTSPSSGRRATRQRGGSPT